jgi:hydroxymethylglutaryl-CoA lyase
LARTTCWPLTRARSSCAYPATGRPARTETGRAIRRFDASLGGVGGCPFAPGAAGNIATGHLVNPSHGTGIATGIDPAGLTRVRDQLRVLPGRPLDSALSAIPAAPAELASDP